MRKAKPRQGQGCWAAVPCAPKETLRIRGVPRKKNLTARWKRPRNRPKVSKLVRRQIFIEQRGFCMWCGHVLSPYSFTIDHVIPLMARWAYVGLNSRPNLVAACRECNGRKHEKVVDLPSDVLHRMVTGERPAELEAEFSQIGKDGWRPSCRGVLRSRAEILEWAERNP